MQQVQLNLAGRRVYVALPDGPARAPVVRRVLDAGGAVVDHWLSSDVIVAANPAQPGPPAAWHACLRGCSVVCPAALLNGRGPALQWAAATNTRRRVWISPRFVACHPHLAAALDSAIQDSGGRWRRLSSKAAFLLAARGGPASKTIAVLSSVEKERDKDLPHCKRARAATHAA